ncbi:MAG: MerR family transcriptional regulator [Roseitalea sp.]|jgi:DNA-binding transcriptional MerR regulator|uniref:MerR family transcriptional regulator n=1 Tax=Oceaniradius stylonematis TaxID=2184161 RepID=A0A3A8AAD6_9HYPH|nr:MerR family transcriptional regulator [Oceaniradius stylonematis]MBO6553015.1 MerR family transcriptional regulator [Roseitalea sp.]MBO6951225.1 MerR family transcriptional regulator [Rhizobiaceae bacterium]RNC93762.1 MAG: MerR family transcriptional regulator [Oricola sp.]MBO6590788.1 MerR family transcriptional regulator [Roseitalea sp.]MBO6599954.1 MerR family transcriptional regulator [Roseitalea sp.]
MTDKSPDAFRTISEVADDLDLPQHVLRFWETRFSQIKPLKRGGGRRYYRPTDVDLLRGIRHLLYEEGYTIKGVQKILRENGIQFAIAIGTGDMSALEEMTRRNAEARQAEAETEAAAPQAGADAPPAQADADVVVGHARPRGRGLFGLGGKGGESGEGADLSRDNRTLLQEALFDLLECKRLLDQTR